ncbi:MAG: glycosyltransferase family 2 protein [Flavobacteriales bacterium]|nr:glycosyltransferase family 2 protein [Flavobacteriales bacterium]
MNQKISIIVSSFNEEKGLLDFGRSLIEQLKLLAAIDFEVIWVNDGSSDQTGLKISEIGRQYSATNISHTRIDFSKNFGHEAAMIAGIDNANGDAIICMDADGQHPADQIPKMVDLFNEGKDYVLMYRTQREDNGLIKRTLSSLFYKMINWLSEIPFQKNSSDFFLISKDIADILRTSYREKNRFIRGFIQSLGFTSGTIEFSSPKRTAGESKYSYKKLFKLAISAIFTFSFKPLRLSTYFAFLFIILTVCLSIYSVYQYIYGNTPPSGYTTIVLFISFSFTLLFSILSVQLLYFEKLIEEIRQSQLYIIKSKQVYTNAKAENEKLSGE